jgi:hypothetical protein
MIYLHEIQAAASDPEAMEAAYQGALQNKDVAAFQEALEACYAQAPENLLYAAWHIRLRQAAPETAPDRTNAVNWALAVPLSVALGIILFLLSGGQFEPPEHLPYLLVAWAPISTCFVLAFLAATSREQVRRAAIVSVGLLVALLYVSLFVELQTREHYRLLMILHLPLLAWIGCGFYLLGWGAGYRERFAFVIKSVEVFIIAGLYIGAGGAFAGVTIGMFVVLGISLPETVIRLLFAGGGGLIPVLAVASSYDPHLSPITQRARQGLGKIISTLMRLLLPLALLVLLVYLAAIPFNFMEPFDKRETLIVYNVMLFAVMGLLVGATPVHERDLAGKHHRTLRAGILAVAVLATVVSLYALSAVLYRTVLGGFTVNRVTVIGWNGINIGILVLLVVKQLWQGAETWLDSLQTVFGWAMRAYAVWATFLVLAIPLLFSE